MCLKIKEKLKERLSKKYLSVKSDNIQGKLILVLTPINYYFITDKQTYDGKNKEGDAVFDIEGNEFIKQ